MQKLYVESQFPVSPEETWDVFESDAFRDRLAIVTGLTTDVLDTRMEGDVEVRHLRYTSGKDLPAIAAKTLGTSRLSYEQTNRFDKANSKLHWNVVLPKMSDRVTVQGVTWIKATPTGSQRVVDGTIEVKMRLVGGQIEKVVAGEFEKSMRRAVELALEMMAESKRA